MAEAFAEWLRRWHDEPERYASESDMRGADQDNYGASSAAYLTALMEGSV